MQCDIVQRDTQGTKNDQKPKIGIPFVLGKAAQKAAQRFMSTSRPPMTRGAEIENINIFHFLLGTLNNSGLLK